MLSHTVKREHSDHVHAHTITTRSAACMSTRLCCSTTKALQKQWWQIRWGCDNNSNAGPLKILRFIWCWESDLSCIVLSSTSMAHSYTSPPSILDIAWAIFRQSQLLARQQRRPRPPSFDHNATWRRAQQQQFSRRRRCTRNGPHDLAFADAAAAVDRGDSVARAHDGRAATSLAVCDRGDSDGQCA